MYVPRMPDSEDPHRKAIIAIFFCSDSCLPGEYYLRAQEEMSCSCQLISRRKCLMLAEELLSVKKNVYLISVYRFSSFLVACILVLQHRKMMSSVAFKLLSLVGLLLMSTQTTDAKVGSVVHMTVICLKYIKTIYIDIV